MNKEEARKELYKWLTEYYNKIYSREKKKDYATLSSIKKNNPKLYNAYIERGKANE